MNFGMQFGVSPNYFKIYEPDLFKLYVFFCLFNTLLLVWPQGHLLVTNDTWWCPNNYDVEVNLCLTSN